MTITVADIDIVLKNEEASGATIANSGILGGSYTISGGVQNTDWSRHTGTAPAAYTSKDTTSFFQQATTGSTGPGTTVETINFAIKFRQITALASGGGAQRLLYVSAANTPTQVDLIAAGTTGAFDVQVSCADSIGRLLTATITGQNLQLNTDYVLSGAVDFSTISAAVLRIKVDALTTVTSSPVDFSGGASTFANAWPILFSPDTGYGLKRIYAVAYQRGGNAWDSTDLGTINANMAVLWATDTVAPTYGVNPHSTQVANTTATFGATASDAIDSAVDHYMGVYANGSTPTASQIKTGAGTGFVGSSNKSQTNIANGVAATFAQVTALSPATDYDAWFTVEEHGATKNPATPFKVDFKTAPTLAIGTVGHLTVSGKTVLLAATPVPTKVTFTLKRAWDNANYASITGIGYAVYGFDLGTQVIGSKLAGGTAETTDGSGVLEVTTTTSGYLVGASVIVLFWKLAGGPASENICGMSFETLVAGP